MACSLSISLDIAVFLLQVSHKAYFCLVYHGVFLLLSAKELSALSPSSFCIIYSCGAYLAWKDATIQSEKLLLAQALLDVKQYAKRLAVVWLAISALLSGPIAYQTFEPVTQVWLPLHTWPC